MRGERGYTLLELLVAVLLVATSATLALATWSMSSRAPANKRATEMGVFIATQELERLKAMKYMGTVDTPLGSPNVAYYDRYGARVGAPAAQGFVARSWVMSAVDRDGINNTEDLKELRVEVWDANQTRRYETARVLLAFGGI